MSKAFYTILYVIILVFVGGVVAHYTFGQYDEYANPCALPLTYAVGDVDERFGLGRALVLRTVLEAEELWEDAVGDDVFRYDESAQLKINFIFDERQADTLSAQRQQDYIAQKDAQYEQQQNEIQELRKTFNTQAAVYEEREQQFISDLSDYNDRVKEINDDGGASKKKREKLEKERKELNARQEVIEDERLAVNDRLQKLQDKISEINAFSETLNKEVQEFNDEFGQERIFDQGEFTGDEIVIYQYRTRDDLRLVIAHELGHARGLDHVTDPLSIMSRIFREQDSREPTVTTADKQEFIRACNPEVSLEKIF